MKGIKGLLFSISIRKVQISADRFRIRVENGCGERATREHSETIGCRWRYWSLRCGYVFDFHQSLWKERKLLYDQRDFSFF